MKRVVSLLILSVLFFSCKKQGNSNEPPPPVWFDISAVSANGNSSGLSYRNLNNTPIIRISFTAPLDRSSVASGFLFRDNNAAPVPLTFSYDHGDSVLQIQPGQALRPLTPYTATVSTLLKSTNGSSFVRNTQINLLTAIDSTDKFPRISDSALLDLVQSQTFKYFWDFGHPVSGLARERNTSAETVTTGGSGFGIMAIPVAISRNFISRAEGITRMQKIVGFLKNTAQHFHGAFPHWMNGTTGVVIPFQANDDGADIVETSYLMMGLLTARQYFNGANSDETNLRNDINTIWNGVEWDWFRKDGKKVLYWNWSPNTGFAINFPVQGWNETLITYVMAASSTTHGIPKDVYDSGFARNGNEKNGKSFYGFNLPLGEDYGGPLFFEQYSFLGINPFGLRDAYADYDLQVINHSQINYSYCVANPRGYYGYSNQCWGLTASDVQNGYNASSPTNDVGVIAPTAAISSLPYTRAESMTALRFFYYKLGDKIWGPYGFYDAFSLNDAWVASSYLAIDEGPIISMIENYRTGMLWDLFMSCPEVKTGLSSLGFF